MKNSKKIITLSLVAVISFCAILFSGCSLTDNSSDAIGTLTSKVENIESILKETEEAETIIEKLKGIEEKLEGIEGCRIYN